MMAFSGADIAAGAGVPTFLSDLFGSSGWLAWSHEILIIGLISLFIAVLLHMFGIAFNIPTLKMYAKGEYMQVILTFIMAGAMIAIIALTWNIMVDIISTTYMENPVLYAKVHALNYPDNVRLDPFAFNQYFIKTTMVECEQNIYRTLYTINFFYKITSTLKAETIGVEPVGGWYATAYTGFFEYVIGHLNPLLLLNWLQIRFLSVVKYVGPLLIEMGLVLRVFPASRGAGGILFAIGFGFFAVYPISLAALTALQPAGSSFCTEFVPPPILDVGINQGSGADSNYVFMAKGALLAKENDVADILNKAKNFIPLFYVQAAFLPMVALIITFTFIRQTGALFGADLNEIGRGLIKLI